MKKITMTLLAVLLTAVLASFAFADPGWSTSYRYGNHGRANRRHHQFQQHDYRGHWSQNHHPVVVSRTPVFPHRPVVRVYEPQEPGFWLYFPHFSISIR
jgi:hypothetical protein